MKVTNWQTNTIINTFLKASQWTISQRSSFLSKIYHSIHKNSVWNSGTLYWDRWIQCNSYFSKIHLNITVQGLPKSPIQPPYMRYLNQNFICISILPHVLCALPIISSSLCNFLKLSLNFSDLSCASFCHLAATCSRLSRPMCRSISLMSSILWMEPSNIMDPVNKTKIR